MPLLSRDVGGQGGGIEEAPLDGKLYGRRMARWDPVPTLLTLIYYRGPFATPDELRAAHPTDIPGAYAVVSSTSSIWIWNHDKWEDTGATQTQAGILDAPKDGNTYGRKDGDWVVVGTGTINEEEVILIIKNTQHNVLKGIQGGKVEGGQVTEAYHLTKEEWEKLPIRPAVISPANGATNINQVPQIVGTPYAHPYDVPMFAKHIQIAKTNDFTAPVYDKEEFSGTPVFQVPLKPDNSPYLTQDTTHYVRIRYQDRKGRWSHWSAPSKFKTMVQFPAGILLTPVMLAPVDGGQVQGINPVLAMSAPKVAVGSAIFDKADWQVSTDSTFGTTIYDKVASDDITMHTTENLNLVAAIGVDYFARGRQRTTLGEYTPWALPVRFGIRPAFNSDIFGLRRIFSKSEGRVICQNIDINGDVVYITKNYWDQHPLYAFAKQQVVMTQDTTTGQNIIGDMVFLPPCWEKVAVYNNHLGDMVIDLWFCATEKKGDGWFLDPAFRNSPNGILCSAGLGKLRTVSGIGDVLTAEPNASGNWYAYADRKKVYDKFLAANISRDWHNYTFYEQRLIHDLMAAEFITNTVTAVSGGSGGANDETSFKYRNFFGLFNTWRLSPSGFSGLFFKREEGQTPIACISLPHEPITAELSVSDVVKLPVSGYVHSGGTSFTSPSLPVMEIHTGMEDLFGFDIAILGIPKRLQEGGVSPFSYSAYADGYVDALVPARLYGNCNGNKTGYIFGASTARETGSSSYTCFRLSKWLS